MSWCFNTLFDFFQTKTLHVLFAQAVVEECRTLLESMDGVTSVHSRFYELSSNYHKLMGHHADYYKDALRFLGCTSLDNIPGN